MFSAFIDELKKQLQYLLKKLLKWANKNGRILKFTMFYFFIKIKKNTWRYYFTPAYQKS